MKENNTIGYVLENKFSLHTIEFEMDIRKEEIRLLKKNIKKNKFFFEREETKDYRIIKYSILTKAVRISLCQPKEFVKGKYLPYMIKLVVNLRSLVEDKLAYFGIFHNSLDNINLVLKKLDEIPDLIGLKGYKFVEVFNLTRVDLCTNYIFRSKELTDKIFKLMKRCDGIGKMQPKLYYDKKAKRKKKSKDEIKFLGDSVSISIYNKISELENNNKQEALSENTYQGFIRFEVIWYNKKISKLKEKYIQYNDLAFLLRDIHIHSRINIAKYVKKLFKTGAYLTMEEAKSSINKAVENKVIKEKTALKMIELIYEVSKRGSYYEAVKNNAEYLKLEKKFENLGINPVTIPIRWECECLPSPYMFLEFDDEELHSQDMMKLEEIKNEEINIKELKNKFKKKFINYRVYEKVSMEELLRSMFFNDDVIIANKDAIL